MIYSSLHGVTFILHLSHNYHSEARLWRHLTFKKHYNWVTHYCAFGQTSDLLSHAFFWLMDSFWHPPIQTSVIHIISQWLWKSSWYWWTQLQSSRLEIIFKVIVDLALLSHRVLFTVLFTLTAIIWKYFDDFTGSSQSRKLKISLHQGYYC